MVAERTALHHDMFAHLVKRLQLQHFIEAVLNHRITEPGGYVVYLRPFTHRLFDLAVHEHRATGAEVIRVLRQGSHACKIAHFVA